MKAVCSFCKTSFRPACSGAGKCPVCGHRNGAAGARATARLWCAAAMFLGACLFAIAAITIFDRNRKGELLAVSISDVRITKSGYVVRGNIRNFSDKTYSVPDLVFALKTGSGMRIAEVVQLPPSGLIDPLSDIEFVKKIEPLVPQAERIGVSFAQE